MFVLLLGPVIICEIEDPPQICVSLHIWQSFNLQMTSCRNIMRNLHYSSSAVYHKPHPLPHFTPATFLQLGFVYASVTDSSFTKACKNHLKLFKNYMMIYVKIRNTLMIKSIHYYRDRMLILSISPSKFYILEFFT